MANCVYFDFVFAEKFRKIGVIVVDAYDEDYFKANKYGTINEVLPTPD